MPNCRKSIYKIQNLNKITAELYHMFESFSKKTTQSLRLQCYRCNNQVQDQFVLLLCDHVLCATCLEDVVVADSETHNQPAYDGLRCLCGVVSCFKTMTTTNHQQSDLDTTANVYIHETNQIQRSSTKDKQSTRLSTGVYNSKKTTSTKKLSNILQNMQYENQQNTNVHSQQIIDCKNSRRTPGNITRNQSIRSSRKRNVVDKNLERHRLLLQRSKYPIQSLKMIEQENGKIRGNADYMLKRVKGPQKNEDHSKHHYHPKYIDSVSVDDSSSENQDPNDTHLDCTRNTSSSVSKKKGKGKGKGKGKDKIFCQVDGFRAQIDFLQLTHNKNLESLERAFLKAKKRINQDYEQMQNSLQDLCLESFAHGRETHVDIGKLIKKRYETCIGDPLERLTQAIRVGQRPAFRTDLLDSQNLRPTVYSSPRIQRETRLQTQPASIYSPTSYHKKIYQHDESMRQKNNLDKYEYRSTHRPFNEFGTKLVKKGKRRTNIVIEL